MKFRNVDKRKLITVIIAVILMGVTNAFLARCDFGTDPYTLANLGISDTIGWTLGTWQLTLNIIMFIVLLVFARSQMGWGTIANMVLVGYSFDFTTWLTDRLIPASVLKEGGIFKSMGMRLGVVIPSLILFVFAAALYMAVQLGTSPYDAIPFVICEKNKKIPFRPLRIAYDSLFAAIGVVFGARIGFVTIAMCLCLGPAVSWMKDNLVNKIFGEGKAEE